MFMTAMPISSLVGNPLPNSIERASWLTIDEKRILLDNVDNHPHAKRISSLKHVFVDRRLWILGLIDACIMIGVYATSFWLPSILRDTGESGPLKIGFWMVLPNAAAVISMLWCDRSSDRARAAGIWRCHAWSRVAG
ncbi:hypothetical protein DIE22_37390 [Burkholderia sp. Bp9142]|nr:hypothetical protein DIE22_37390 [Burkholderia sp. Bp9142]